MTLNNCCVLADSDFVLHHKWLLTDFKQVKNLVFICWIWRNQKDVCHYQKFVCTCCSWQSAGLLYIIIWQNLFLPVRTLVFYLQAFIKILKHRKYWYFFYVKNIVTWIIFDWIINTKCFINIYHHNNIATKPRCLNISAKNFQNAKRSVVETSDILARLFVKRVRIP